MTCPKCHGKMMGPRYCTDERCQRREHMHYQCVRCGYRETRPCADATRDADAEMEKAGIP